MGWTEFKRPLAEWLREKIMRHYRAPHSRRGLEPGVAAFLDRGRPVSLIDIGASVGGFTQSVLDHCGIRNALLVEPQSAHAAELKKRFPQSNIAVRQCAAADKDGWADMDILNWDYSSSLLPVKRDVSGIGRSLDLGVREKIRVRLSTLDDLMAAAWRGEPVDLLKIDVQGGELGVLRGAPETLKCTHMIWTEIAFRPVYDGGASFFEVYRFLTDAGFILTWISPGLRGERGELLEGDAMFARRN